MKDNGTEKFQQFFKNINHENVAILIVNNQNIKIQAKFPILRCDTEQWLELQKELSDILYPYDPTLKFAAATGTNGKTSTIHFIMQILKQLNIQSLSIGTLGVYNQEKKLTDFSLTSPSYIDFRKVVNKFAKDKSVVVFEMSSHALDQKRFYKIPLTVAGWTSFTQDHLDYHETMEKYFASKKMIISYLTKGAKLLIPESQKQLHNLLSSLPGIRVNKNWNDYKFLGTNEIFKAKFAQDNFILAFEMCQEILGKKIENITLNEITTAPGRWMLKTFDQKTVIIDYAHTPDALINVCINAKNSFQPPKLKVLFGCGGDRDKTKRPLMGKAVDQFADFIYVTSDNPRTENPDKIIDDIMPGITKPCYRNIDREMTLQKALSELLPQEVLIVAGKGHENYIIHGTTKFPYSDEAVCDKFIKTRKK